MTAYVIFHSLILSGFILTLAYYLMTNLQWYDYSLHRVLTKHHKRYWHVNYFLLPLGVFIITCLLDSKLVFLGFSGAFICLYLPFLLRWILQLDKRLKFTRRVISFFVILVGFLLLHQGLYFLTKDLRVFSLLFLLPLVFALITSNLYERILFSRYKAIAKRKINSLIALKIITITGSFGKTSIKNFLEKILSTKYQVYATPRSVNTIKGIVSDINTSLPPTTQIYIAEAGARQKGDISEIATLLHAQYAIIGEIGEQHIEYFKTAENVVQTKYELLESNRLKKALVYEGNTPPATLPQKTLNLITPYPKNLRNIEATLEKTSFELEIKGVYHPFETNLLGTFNVANLSAAILMAVEFDIPIPTIQRAVSKLDFVQNRLQKYTAGGKIILDDGFNGNLKGMLEAIRLSGLYEGRKVIITPGLVESTDEANIHLAKAIDGVFDLAIITGELNSKILSSHISRPQKIILKDKSQLTHILLTSTHKGDLLLFANDAPTFI